MGIIIGIVIAIAVLFLLNGIITIYFYGRTMRRQRAKVERTIKMAGTDWSQHMEVIEKRKDFLLSQTKEEWTVTSFDGLKLRASFFPPVQETQGKKKVAICFHGYTSQSLKDFIGLSDYYFKKGFAQLHPDARAHGESEGTYIGFGCLDRKDALMWINKVIEKYGEDVEIILHGISMGGATVLMASGLELPVQVKGVISDCGFTSPKEVFSHVLRNMYHMQPGLTMLGANFLNKRLAGYGMDECNAKREVAKAKVPILFIHGSGDTFVPHTMCEELYNCCTGSKKKLIIEGAAHAESYFKDMPAYEKYMDEFMNEVFA